MIYEVGLLVGYANDAAGLLRRHYEGALMRQMILSYLSRRANIYWLAKAETGFSPITTGSQSHSSGLINKIYPKSKALHPLGA